MDDIYWGLDTTLPDELFIGDGTAFRVKGWVFHPHLLFEKVGLCIDKAYVEMEEINYPREDVITDLKKKRRITKLPKSKTCCGFSGVLDLLPGWEGQKKEIHFKALFKNGEEFIFGQKQVYIQNREDYFTPLEIKNEYDAAKPLVTICMATYMPELEAFQKQIDSIHAQSYQNWVCIITDDCSDQETTASIRTIISGDQRFYFYQNKRNLGYYRNFEQALRHAPVESQLIGFCDQDDYWYPDKLAKLVTSISTSPDYQLVYSDMHIVDKAGKLISTTYWNSRTNYYKSLDLVLLCNTITGAASIFRRELLDKALPLPPHTRESYHDHVVACTALATGRVAYIDEPLYAYIQHGRNVIGHMELLNVGENGLLQLFMKNLKSGRHFKAAVKSLKDNFEVNYFRLRLLARSLELRGLQAGGAIRLFNNRWSGIIRLMILHFRIRARRLTTDNAELAISFSYLARKLYRFIY